MSHELHLPYLASIPYAVQIEEELSDASKIFYGQITGLSIKYGYIFATNEQLALMKKTSEKNIERWLQELESFGFISRQTINTTEKDEQGDVKRHANGSVVWTKKRKIFITEGFSKKEKTETPKNEESYDIPKNEESEGTPKNEGYKDKPKLSTEKNNNRASAPPSPPPSVVVPSLDKIIITASQRTRLEASNTADRLDRAVELCLNWKDRPNDELGINWALKNLDTVKVAPTKEEKLQKDQDFLGSLSHLDGQSGITIGAKYIEFVAGPMKCDVYQCGDSEFIKKVTDHLKSMRIEI